MICCLSALSCGSASRDGVFASSDSGSGQSESQAPELRPSPNSDTPSPGESDSAQAGGRSSPEPAPGDDSPSTDTPQNVPAADDSSSADESQQDSPADDPANADAPQDDPPADDSANADAPQNDPAADDVDAPPAADEPPEELSQIVIDRARYDADDEELQVRGSVSSADVELVVEFGEQQEALVNEGGSFDAEFSDIAEPPELVTVIASDGAIATLEVEIRD